MNATTKVDFLFRFVSPSRRAQLQFDDEALWSVTDQVTADRMTLDLLRFVSPSETVADGTACVGGNAASLASAFARVVAVEVNGDRAAMLVHNMRVLGALNVDVLQGDCLQALPLCQDVAGVLLDPPWGGPGYRARGSLDLRLSGRPLAAACAELGERCPALRVLALKLPKSGVDVDALAAALAPSGWALVHRNERLRKVRMVVFKKHLPTG